MIRKRGCRNVAKKAVCLLFMLLFLAACGSSPASREHSADFFAMDTYMSIRAWGAEEGLLPRAEQLVNRLESELSVTRDDSVIAVLNRSGSALLPDDVIPLFETALNLCEDTGGALDISVYPVLRAWGFTAEEYRVPSETELASLLESVNYRQIAFDPATGEVSVPDGCELDLGSVAKGYTADLITALLRENGVTSALLDLGGNIQAIGTKPDGSSWRVAVQDPAGQGYLGVVNVADSAVVTSGGYERFFTDESGNTWWHIIDPATGYPAHSGLLSVTVIGKSGVFCDGLSTALFIMGRNKSESYWREHRDFEMILMTEEGQLIITDGISDSFTPAEGMTAEVISG